MTLQSKANQALRSKAFPLKGLTLQSKANPPRYRWKGFAMQSQSVTKNSSFAKHSQSTSLNFFRSKANPSKRIGFAKQPQGKSLLCETQSCLQKCLALLSKAKSFSIEKALQIKSKTHRKRIGFAKQSESATLDWFC